MLKEESISLHLAGDAFFAKTEQSIGQISFFGFGPTSNG
jgi:hypothetical protein